MRARKRHVTVLALQCHEDEEMAQVVHSDVWHAHPELRIQHCGALDRDCLHGGRMRCGGPGTLQQPLLYPDHFVIHSFGAVAASEHGHHGGHKPPHGTRMPGVLIRISVNQLPAHAHDAHAS